MLARRQVVAVAIVPGLALAAQAALDGGRKTTLSDASSDFEDVYQRHAPAAFRRASRLLGRDADAHEVVHDVFLWLFERPTQYRGQTRLSTSSYSSVTNGCLNHLNETRARKRWPRARESEQLRAMLLRMPAALAEVAVYYYMDELTLDEIARVLECSRAEVDELVEQLVLDAQARGGVPIERARPESCPSDLVLDAWAAAELAEKVVVQVEKHLAHCAECQARRAAFERERAVFLRAAPTFAAQRKLVAASRPTLPITAASKMLKTGGAAAFALLAIGVVGLLSWRPWADAPRAEVKGAAHLGVLVAQGKHVTRPESGAEVKAGDRLRFTHTSDRDLYLALFNVGAHGVSVYFPRSGGEGQRVRAGKDVALDFDVEVVATSGVIRAVGVFCRAPFEIAPLLTVLEASGTLSDERDCHVDELRLKALPAP